MRLFIAVNFDEQLKQRILAVQNRIRQGVKCGKFPPPENFHLTLVFLGEIPEEYLPKIKAVMMQAASSGGKPDIAFELVFSHTGFFKRGAKELWWLGTDSAENRRTPPSRPDGIAQLEKLQKKLASEFIAHNFLVDSRSFTPHITLGREIQSNLWPFKTENINIPVRRLSLMRTERITVSQRENKLVYTELFGYNLGAEQ